MATVTNFYSNYSRGLTTATPENVMRRRHCVAAAKVFTKGKEALAVVDYYTPSDPQAPSGFYIGLRLPGKQERKAPLVRAYIGKTLAGMTTYFLERLIEAEANKLMAYFNPESKEQLFFNVPLGLKYLN